MSRPIKGREIVKVLLGVLGVVGVIGVGLAAPGLVNVLSKEFLRRHRWGRRQVREAVNYLRRREVVRLRQTKDGSLMATLTHKGRRYIKTVSMSKLVIPKPQKWDGRWRMVSFDIPEKYKVGRDALRQLLKSCEFYQWQKSVFIHPYPCEDEIAVVRKTYGLEPFVKLVLISEFEGMEMVKRKFGLR